MHDNWDAQLSEIQYLLIPQKLLSSKNAGFMLNLAFEFWDEFWQKTLAENKDQAQDFAQNFCWADGVGILLYGSKVIGVHLYTFYNLDLLPLKHHPYFSQHYGNRFLEHIKMHNKSTAISLGYLAIHPDWRKAVVGVSLGATLIGLGIELQKSLEIDTCVGRCRKDVKTNEMLINYGGQVIEENYCMHNTPTDFIVIHSDKAVTYPDEQVATLVTRLWQRRIDCLRSFIESWHIDTAKENKRETLWLQQMAQNSYLRNLSQKGVISSDSSIGKIEPLI